ncbi:5-(carboxyamino)imidazole ribonucleotide mutase [Candidatus Oleimmundimicrobium sp.]|uniref:5-(carboxyamino)imidazole ribonucleotide mutase n=1 Tax=Candidatus Oleimmundimicrobium sp. TaxID=3060597 RepID=UPI00271D171D|nr:5-(carboxyamino)imidazole ribonucleotide mutase [Candidatus Oleimmundimicrobium sp.]MDO8885607.1 5-(carboxyamino)imidazole ribonucleotide mutase [Candidatus Oleimmundimicrobium sp.]
MKKPLVGILMGSVSDEPVMKVAKEILDEFEISNEVHVMSAHRTPKKVQEYALTAEEKGVEVIICGAGKAAHLAGAIASYTILPVIGVPISSKDFGGMDALLATVQMPNGVPVATVAIGGAKNAGILATQILSIKYPKIREALKKYKENLAAR